MATPTIFGLLWPLQRDQKKDFAAGSGGALLQSKIANVLTTSAQSAVTAGELPWNLGFGSLLERLRHKRNNVSLQHEGRALVVDALKRWVPSARLTDAVFSRESSHGRDDTLVMRLVYDRVDPNSGNVLEKNLELLLRV